MLLKANLDGCSALPELAVIPRCVNEPPSIPTTDHRENRGQGWEKRKERQQFCLEENAETSGKGGGGVAGRGEYLEPLRPRICRSSLEPGELIWGNR